MALNDQYNLGQSSLFRNRVRQSVTATCFAVYDEASGTAGHAARAALAVRFLASPDSFVHGFTASVATDIAVSGGVGTVTATNADTQQALITDAQINNAVSSQWNAYAGA